MRSSCRHIRLQSAVRRLPALAALLLVAVALVEASAHPKPAAVPYRWELEFKPGDLRLYVDPVEQRPFWYFTYEVTNRSGRDHVWAPSLTLFTDAGEILPAGSRVPTRVVSDLVELLQNPLLEDQNSVIGDIRQGEEHAKEGIVVWPADDLDVNEINLFISGISGETARVRNPVTAEEFILRKTLQRNYLIRGEAMARKSEPIEFVDEAWIMR